MGEASQEGASESATAGQQAASQTQQGGSQGDAAHANGNAGSQTTEGQSSARVVVHVDGAVAVPGVYELGGADPRVGDAIEAAGGLTGEADTSTLNLAAKVTDGTKVHVPVAGETAAATAETTVTGGSEGAGQAGTAASAGSTGASGSGPVNINTATAEELDALPGVGPSTAQAIVDDRQKNGPFSRPEDLMRVSGIGEKKFAKLEGSIRV